ncbi:MAG: flagellar type III secretion system pore protein FliP [Porticoccaceae bacterium]
MKRALRLLGLVLLLSPWAAAWAAPGITLVDSVTNAAGGQSYAVPLKILLVMTVLTLLPSALIMMTSFTRVVIVLSILRQALGTPQTPSNQILIGIALFLSLFIMAPVFERANTDALQPYLAEQIAGDEAMQRAQLPFREFMLGQTRESDLALFAGLAGKTELANSDEIPFSVLVPSFIISELKTAFQIGFLIFIPFVIIDLVVASVLMSMGMMMLSPMLISLPFKLMLFVLVDGWSLIVSTLAASFDIA